MTFDIGRSVATLAALAQVQHAAEIFGSIRADARDTEGLRSVWWLMLCDAHGLADAYGAAS